MKTLHLICSVLIISLVLAVGEDTRINLRELAIAKARKIMIAQGKCLDMYAAPIVYDKGSKRNPIEGWAKRIIGEKKLAKLRKIDYIVVEYAVKDPRDVVGGRSLYVFTADKNLTLVCRSGIK